MEQRVVALLSLAGGLFGFGLAGLIQLDRTVLTTPRPPGVEAGAAMVSPARTETRASSEPLVSQALPESHVISLEPIFVTGSARPKSAAAIGATSTSPQSDASAPATPAAPIPDT